MNLHKRLLFSTVSRLNVTWLKGASPVDLLVPYHHLVADEPVPYLQHLYRFKNTQQFRTDLDFLLKNFKPVSLPEVIEQQKKGEPFREKSFLLTFDDGLRQVYETVAPLLLRRGVPAALFINPEFVDNKRLFYDLKKGLILNKLTGASFINLATAGQLFGKKLTSMPQLRRAVTSIHYGNQYLADEIGKLLEIDFDGFTREQQPFMTTEQIRVLIQQGFHVGAHSLDHPLYSAVSLEEQVRQTVESMNRVCRTFNLPYKTFAFPHVDTGVSHAFFTRLFRSESSPPDLIFGNRTGMLEKGAAVRHRFIGENPALPVEVMVKAVLTYGLVRKVLHKQYIQRKSV